jgi:transketolase
MRRAFLTSLVELAERDPRVLFLTGDLGYMVVEAFAERLPGRFFNVGVAEQNMLGVAAGLAEAGYLPFCYSIAPFASLRPYEFFRNCAVMQRLPVRLVGAGGGFEYGHNGPTHYGLEDLGVMRIQPGLTVIAPADELQTARALQKTWDLPGPVYYRLGKDSNQMVVGLDGRFELGHAERVRDGDDVLLLASGRVAVDAIAAAEELAKSGVSAAVVVVASLSPAPVEDLARELRRFELCLTVEAHYVTGGLGSLVAEVIAEHGLGCRLLRHGAREAPTTIGSQEYMHRQNGLASDQLAEAALKSLGERRTKLSRVKSRG